MSDDYTRASHFNRQLSEAELQSERKQPPAPERKPEPPANMAAEWQSYIDTVIKRAERRTLTAAMAAVGEVLIAERAKMRAELEAEIMKLRNEFLRDTIDRERGAKLKTVVPLDKGAMIA